MTDNQRVKELVSFLKENKRIRNQQDFVERIGSDKSTVSQVLSDKLPIPNNMFDKICNAFPDVSQSWLRTGEGNMLRDDKLTEIHIPESGGVSIETLDRYNKAKELGIPLLPEVDFKFAAGQTQLLNNSENITRYWFLPDCRDCEGVAQVIGRSMSPTLPSGSWVALKRLPLPVDNPNTIPFGNIFGVVVEDKYTGEYHGHIKILRRYKDKDLSRKYWIAHSINENEFDDFDIEISQVRSLWIVKQHIVSDIL